MRTLFASLTDHPMALLRGIAEARGFDLGAGPRAEAAGQLAAVLAAPGATEMALQDVSPEARAAWQALCASDGHMKAPAFLRAFGPIRPIGPGRLEREQPWREPAGPAEELWYRGLIFRAFADLGEGPLEYIYIPPELSAMCMPAASPEGGALEGAAAPQRSLDAQNSLAVDATYLLAGLRAAPVRADAGGQVRPDDQQYLLEGLISPDALRLDLLLTLLRQLGWLTLARGRLSAQPDAASAWLRAGMWEQMTALFEAWRNSTDAVSGSAGWNDLRRMPGVRAEGSWRNDPALARRAVADLLRATPDEWRTLDAFVAAMKAARTDFQRPDGVYTGWYLRDVETGRYLTGFEAWDQVEGRLIRFLVSGPLYWLGAVALGANAGSAPDVFRLTPAGRAWLAGDDPPELPRPARLTIRDDLTIVAPPFLPLMDRYRLLRFTEPAAGARAPGQPTQHRITRESLARARADGLKAEAILKFLRRAGEGPVPDKLAAGLERWDQHSGEVRVSRGAVLRVEDAAILALVRSDPVLRPLLGELLSAQAVMVSEANLPRVLAALQELGYRIKVE